MIELAAESDEILAFDQASIAVDAAGLDHVDVDAVVRAGDLWVVEMTTAGEESGLIDAALGLVPPLAGVVRFLGYDWRTLPDYFCEALRGRAGLVSRRGGFLPYANMAQNILLCRRHHSGVSDATLVEAGRILATRFGLPGLPAGAASSDAGLDRLRATCVRAFLGQPALVVVESRNQPWWRELVPPLIDEMRRVRERGGAVVWCLSNDPLLSQDVIPATRRWRLRGRVLEGAGL